MRPGNRGFGLAGAGREWPSYLLTVREPSLFAPWSLHTERALRRLGLLPPGLKQGHPGLCYIDLLDAMQVLRVRLGLPDFRAGDEFCYLNGRNAKARHKRRAVESRNCRCPGWMS